MENDATRELAIFDVYAGLRRIGYTDEGARDRMLVLGLTSREVLKAAESYEGGAIVGPRSAK